MSNNTTILAVTCVVVLGIFTVIFVHEHERSYQLQRACMQERGNWETREGSNEIGCRFPQKPPGVGR